MSLCVGVVGAGTLHLRGRPRPLACLRGRSRRRGVGLDCEVSEVVEVTDDVTVVVEVEEVRFLLW